MLKNILSVELCDALNKIPYNSLCELRLRQNNPAVVNVLGENYYLTNANISKSSQNAINISAGTINKIIQRICNNSLYTINDNLIEGYTIIKGGIRVGVCGEVVSNDGKIKTLKNISSLNFRFPHFFKNCSMNVLPYIICGNEVKNTLIISPPGSGKTTYLRDIIYQLTNKLRLINILVVDERQEIMEVFDGNNVVTLENVDVYKNSSKKFAFNNGIRSMKPDVIITDEISVDKDIDDIENALTSGVKIIATIHASSVFDLISKSQFKRLLDLGLFDRFVVLSSCDGVGTLEGVYNENLIYLGV